MFAHGLNAVPSQQLFLHNWKPAGIKYNDENGIQIHQFQWGGLGETLLFWRITLFLFFWAYCFTAFINPCVGKSSQWKCRVPVGYKLVKTKYFSTGWKRFKFFFIRLWICKRIVCISKANLRHIGKDWKH